MDEPAAASFTGFSKDYFGTLEQIDGLFQAIREDKKVPDWYGNILSVHDQYRAGNKAVQYLVDYQEVPFIVPVTVLDAATSVLENYCWEHRNIRDYVRLMKCDKAECTHIWVYFGGWYSRCIQVRFTNLMYENPIRGLVRCSGATWGFPHQMEFEAPYMYNRLFVVEKAFMTEAAALEDRANFAINPDPIFKWVLDDIFADG